nr:DUF5131 family protein [Mycolicibacter heraklionensis]
MIPSDTAAAHGQCQPIDQLGGGAVDRNDRGALLAGSSLPLDIALPIEESSDIPERSRFGGHLDDGRAQPLTAPAHDTGANDSPSDGFAGNPEALGDLGDGESAHVGGNNVGGISTGVRHLLETTRTPTLDWIVCGGESGHGARPMHPDWARSLRDQCTTAGVPFYFKQWGEHVEAIDPVPSDRWLTGEGTRHDEPWNPDQVGAPAGKWSPYPDVVMRRVGKRAAGRQLDGETWDQYPEAVA